MRLVMSPESGSRGVEQTVEAKGFEEEFESLFDTAYRVTRRLLGHTGDAEDAAAEAVARALVSWRRLNGQPYRHAWVARVAGNAAIDQLRRQRRALPPVRASGDAIEEATMRLALGAALQMLPRRQREVVTMRYLADMDDRAVARTLGISVNSVKKHLQRAMTALRAEKASEWTEVRLVAG